MSIKVVIVDLESIHTPKFPLGSESLIETLANSIVNLRGLIHLPVLYSLGIEEYELLSGHIEFYAYSKAREFDDSLPDRITVLVVDKKHEADIQKQLVTISPIFEVSIPTDTNGSNIDFNNIEAKLERLFSNQNKSINTLQETLLAKLDQSLPQPLPILVAFNRVTEPAIAQQIHKNLVLSLNATTVKKILALLISVKGSGEVFTSLSTTIQKMLITTQKNGRQVRLISDEKMLEVIDRWNQ